jgi:hypothetical protein
MTMRSRLGGCGAATRSAVSRPPASVRPPNWPRTAGAFQVPAEPGEAVVGATAAKSRLRLHQPLANVD